MFIKKLLISTIVFVVSWVIVLTGWTIIAPTASAHEVATDGSIAAVLHIDPQDDPIVGEQAAFHLEFKDSAGKFNEDQCDCRASISNAAGQLFSTELVKSAFVYTFPEKGIYKLEVNGQPKEVNAFQTFHLSYDLRVDRTGGSSISLSGIAHLFKQDHLVHLIVFGIGFVIIGILYLREKLKKRRKNGSPPSQVIKGFIILFILSNFLLAHGILAAACPDPDSGHMAAQHICCLPQPPLITGNSLTASPLTQQLAVYHPSSRPQ